MREHGVECAELPGMHVRRSVGNVAERRHLERALELVTIDSHIFEFLAVRGLGIAPSATAVELVGEHCACATDTPAIGGETRPRRHACVVKFLIGEKRTVVTLSAVG